MYTTSWCGYCARARRLLQSKGVEFEEIDIDVQPTGRAEMVARTRRHTVPQIFIGETHLGGSTELLELEGEGRLDSLLNGG
jgi:glutaredoxin 3